MIYQGECGACGETKEFSYSFAEYDTLKCHPDSWPGRPGVWNTILGTCECGQPMEQMFLGCPDFITNRDIEIKTPGFNVSKGTRTNEQQAALYAHHQKAIRKMATTTKRARSGTKRDDTEIRHIGSVPIEMDVAMRRQTGDRNWCTRDPKKALKRLNLLLDH